MLRYSSFIPFDFIHFVENSRPKQLKAAVKIINILMSLLFFQFIFPTRVLVEVHMPETEIKCYGSGFEFHWLLQIQARAQNFGQK